MRTSETRKRILFAAAISVIFFAAFPPFRITENRLDYSTVEAFTEGRKITSSTIEYALIFSPPGVSDGRVSIDFSQLGVQFLALIALVAIGYRFAGGAAWFPLLIGAAGLVPAAFVGISALENRETELGTRDLIRVEEISLLESRLEFKFGFDGEPQSAKLIGRIQNLSDRDLGELDIRVRLYRGDSSSNLLFHSEEATQIGEANSLGEPIDGDNFRWQGHIPSGETESIEVNNLYTTLRPSPGWSWTYDIVEAVAF